MKIKAYTDYNERTNTRYSKEFEVVDKLPTEGEVIWGDPDDIAHPNFGQRERVTGVFSVQLDPEQGSDEVYGYDFYEVHTQLEEVSLDTDEWEVTDTEWETHYFAIKRA